MRGAIGEQIGLVTMLSPVLAPAKIDPAQFETAILNLVINSRDAMAGSGRITIETRNVTVDRLYAANNPEVTPGPHVMIAVSDSGTGTTRAVLERAFDPFFTTKEVGKGSGLGLSQVYGFAKTAGGHIKIYSEVGVGTTVKLYLPKSSDPPIVPEVGTETASLRPANGHETILLVGCNGRMGSDATRRIAIAPLYGLGSLVVLADISHQLSVQVGDRGEDASCDDVALDLGEP